MGNIIEISHLSKSFGPVQDLSFRVREGELFAFLGVNGAGILLMALMMVPNIAFALTHREGFVNRWSNRTVELLEQMGRFGCFIFMCVRIQPLCGGTGPRVRARWFWRLTRVSSSRMRPKALAAVRPP